MQSSTAPSLPSDGRRLARRLAALAAVAFAVWALKDQLASFADAGHRIRPGWAFLLGSAAVVLVTHGILIQTWRTVLVALAPAAPSLSFPDAARIWWVSNLGRYIPGKVWAIAAMAAMTRDRGIPAMAATGAAILINVVNIVSGIALSLALGAELTGSRAAGVLLAVAGVIALVALPMVIAPAVRIAGKVLRREFRLPDLSRAVIWKAALGTLVAWMLYGIAFRLLVLGVLGEAPGKWSAYTAAFTSSYVLGYIVLVAPGGIGVREGSLVGALSRFPFVTTGAAGVIAVSSRLWLTVIEIIPGLLFIALDAFKRRHKQPS
ncbi:MAG: lysylphosphatidylglycerol synthase domain-containing protein [Gemmatimonadota bacterium]